MIDELRQKNLRTLGYVSMILILCVLTWFSAETEFRAVPISSGQNLTALDASWRLRGSVKKNYEPLNNSIELNNPINKYQTIRGEWNLDQLQGKYLSFNAHYIRRIDSHQKDFDENKILIFVSFRDDKQRISGSPIAKLSPSVRGRHLDSIVKVPDAAETMLLAMVTRVQGTWVLDGISLEQSKLSLHYKVSVWLLASFWLFLFMLVVKRTIKLENIWYVVVVMITVVAIFAGVVSSQQNLHTAVSSFIHATSLGADYLAPSEYGPLFNYGHVLSFLLLTVIVLASANKLKISRLLGLVYIVLLAIASEVVQRHSFTRTPQLFDFALDMAGIIVGAVAIYMVIFIVKLGKH